VPERT